MRYSTLQLYPDSAISAARIGHLVHDVLEMAPTPRGYDCIKQPATWLNLAIYCFRVLKFGAKAIVLLCTARPGISTYTWRMAAKDSTSAQASH